jgi:hypothetical protein
MKSALRLLLLITVIFSSFVVAPLVLADAKSDFEYQYNQYRKNYPEYSLLKTDYLSTPSLDNQQKVILSAKQTIMARDLAKASFAWLIMDLVSATKVTLPAVQPIVSSLGASRQFYLDEAQKSQSIVTQQDMKLFTESYQKDTLHHDRIVKFGVITQKILGLVKLQQDSKAALDNLVTRLPATLPATLIARIEELRDSSLVIDARIETLAKNLNFVEDEGGVDIDNYFSSRVERFNEIRTLQLDWINRLIDIDKNYAQSNR